MLRLRLYILAICKLYKCKQPNDYCLQQIIDIFLYIKPTKRGWFAFYFFKNSILVVNVLYFAIGSLS